MALARLKVHPPKSAAATAATYCICTAKKSHNKMALARFKVHPPESVAATAATTASALLKKS